MNAEQRQSADKATKDQPTYDTKKDTTALDQPVEIHDRQRIAVDDDRVQAFIEAVRIVGNKKESRVSQALLDSDLFLVRPVFVGGVP